MAVAGTGIPGRTYFIASVGMEGSHWVTSDESYAFDPSTGDWDEIPAHPLDQALTEAEAVGTDDGLYLIGRGCEVRRTTGSAYPCGADGSWVGLHFDFESEEWSELDLPEQVTDDQFGRIDYVRPVPHLPGGSAHLFWEVIDRSGFVSQLLILDTATETWTTVDGAVPLSVGSCAVDGVMYGLRPGSFTTAFGKRGDEPGGLRGTLVMISARGHVREEAVEAPATESVPEPLPSYQTFCTGEYLVVGDPEHGLRSESPWMMRTIAPGPWTELPRPDDGAASVVVTALGTDEHIYVLGRDAYGAPSRPVLKFSPEDGTWSQLPDTETAPSTVQSVVVGRDALVMYESSQPRHPSELIVVGVE